nr:type IV toxin-antitoxin system AbiEi family antitoxin domain-containing protein [Xanthomonas citri]
MRWRIGCGWGLRDRCADAGHDHTATTARRSAAAPLRQHQGQRLFLALADRHRHAWLAHVPLDGVDLGGGKRALVPGGRLHPTYQITLPGDLDEHLA